MYRKQHTKGLVLGSLATGESSSLVSLFTKEMGLINARVQGSRKLASRLRSHHQKFSYGDFSLVHGKAGWKLVGAKAEENFFESFVGEKKKVVIAQSVFNLIKKLVDAETESALFDIVINFLNFLKTAEREELALAECLVILRILHNLGYMHHDPELAIPISSTEVTRSDLDLIAPRRTRIISLINESLKMI